MQYVRIFTNIFVPYVHLVARFNRVFPFFHFLSLKKKLGMRTMVILCCNCVFMRLQFWLHIHWGQFSKRIETRSEGVHPFSNFG